MNPDLSKFLHDPLILFIAGALYVLGRDFAVRFLRGHAKDLLADKNPKNDALARGELAAADAIERLPGSIPNVKK